MQALGFRVSVVVKEALGTKELNAEMWNGEIFLDKDMSFFKYVGGGEVHRGDLERRFEPGVNEHREKAKAQYGGNLDGEGLIMGGSMVISKDGKVEFSFLEDNFGVFADLDAEIMPVLRKLAGSSA